MAHRLARLVAAYPDHLAAADGTTLIWKDGTRTAVTIPPATRTDNQVLARPEIGDIFHWPYPARASLVAPAAGADPGRIRPRAFFERMYGNCRAGTAQRHLVEVVWLRRKAGLRLKVTRVNGVARRLDAISRELDRLPARFDRYIVKAAGTFHCRPIAGTRRPSAHGYGIAIDIAPARAHYWRWNQPGPDGRRSWRNAVPREIVATFERYGFIWGGRWHHYDTMHFEYRPELLPLR